MKQIPIGTTRIHNGKLQKRVLSAKGWKFWKNVLLIERVANYTPEQLLALTNSQRAHLREDGFPIPLKSPGTTKGVKFTLEHRANIGKSHRKYLFNINALDSEAKARVRKSFEYQQWRLAVFVRDNWTCQKCGAKSGDGRECYLEAHHVKGYTKHPELRLDVSNGVTLCKDCHRIENKKQMKGNKNGVGGNRKANKV
jgi:hypothetical protein